MTQTRCPQCGDVLSPPGDAPAEMEAVHLREHLRKRHGWTEEKVEAALGKQPFRPSEADDEA